VRNEYLAAAAQERSLTAALEAQKGEALDLNRKTIEYGALERDAVGNRELYERLLQQAQQSGLSSALKAADMAIVDAADPSPVPARPARARNAIASIGGALFGAIGFALLLEFLDRRVKSPDQIKRDLALPYLGYVPLVRSEAAEEPLLIHEEIPASFHEAVRRVRANLMLSTATEGCRLLVVTSTAPREGKTMVSSNLALALSQSGARVLLVDADLRRPRIEEQLGLVAGPGLSDVLTGQRTIDASLRSLKGTALAVLCAGPCPPNPPELLSSPRYRELMSTLRGKYDWIVVDSPPVMAVADAALLAREATGVVFVIGAEMSSIETVREAVDELAEANATILGAVLNRVDLERNGFYYSKYYTPDYEHYYRR
jgi:capsular exopolysaccharide synthesis family protein